MLDLLKTTVREFIDDDAPRLAAALSYYTVFSLPPLLILLLLLAGIFLDGGEARGAVIEEVAAVLGEGAARQVRSMIVHADRPGAGGPLVTLLSLAALVFGATGAFAQLQSALNTAWNVEKGARGGARGFVVKRALSFGMILVIAFLLVVSLAASAFLARAGDVLATALPAAISAAFLQGIDLALSLVVTTLLFAAIFRVLPDVRIPWRDVWPGALATAALFVVGKFGLGFYIARSDPGSAFGAAGSLAVILVWVYYSAMILFLGAEFTQVRARLRGRGIRPTAG